MPEYLLVFAASFQSFRIQELDAIASLLGITVGYDASSIDLQSPFMVVDLASDKEAEWIGSRSILIRHIWRCWAHERTYERVHALLKDRRHLYERYKEQTSFRVTVTSINSKLSSRETIDTINSFAYMDFRGPIDLKSPQIEIGIFEYHTHIKETHLQNRTKRLESVYVGRKICEGQRHLIEKYDVKQRLHIGNTSMEAEVSLLMANQARVRKGSLVYDPFAGTGSMLYVCAEFGAMVMGSDIDGRHMRGKGKQANIQSTLHAYGTGRSLLDCLTFDVTNNPWRATELFDAIVTDPPYGVRAGAKRLGRKNPEKLKKEPVLMHEGDWAHERPDYVPPSTQWEMSEVVIELLDFSFRMLKPGGRLVYWLPTVTEEYSPSDVPMHPGLCLIANSSQDFSQWSRHLITMEKRQDTPNTMLERNIDSGIRHQPAHAQFRDRYFTKFVAKPLQ